MDIIAPADRDQFLKRIRFSNNNLPDWLIVEFRIKRAAKHLVSSTAIAEMIRRLFGDFQGFATICNEMEVLLLIQWGRDNSPQELTTVVQANLPPDSCETTYSPLNSESLKRLVLTITMPGTKDTYYRERAARRRNVFLIADDDMFMRALVKAGLEGEGEPVEIGDGSEVADAYKRYNPDMVLLDIHLPGMSGQMVLDRLTSIDPSAHVIMLSGDSSPENVKWTHQHGAKGFLVKPFSKTRLMDYVRLCPTIRTAG